MILVILVVFLLAVVSATLFTGSVPAGPTMAIFSVLLSFLTLLKSEYGITVLIFSMLLSPEIKLSNLGERHVVLRADDLFLAVTFLTWLAKTAIKPEGRGLVRTPLGGAMLAYVVWSLVATARGLAVGSVEVFRASLYLMKSVEYFFLYFLVANVLQTADQVRLFMRAFLVTAAIVIVLSYTQLGMGAAGRVGTPLEDVQEPATLAAYLVIIFAVAICLAFYDPSTKGRAAGLALAVSLIPPFLATLSRGGFFAFLASYAALMVLLRRARGVLCLVLVGAICAAPLLMPQWVMERVAYTFTQQQDSVTISVLGREVTLEPSAYARLTAWRTATTGERNLVFGRGVSGSGMLDNQYALVLGETGIIGLACFLWLLRRTFQLGRRVLRTAQDPYAKALATAFVAALVGIAAQGLGANTFILIRVMEPFWFLAAVVTRLPELMPAAREASGDLLVTDVPAARAEVG